MKNFLKNHSKCNLGVITFLGITALAVGVYFLIDNIIHPPVYIIAEFFDLGPLYKRMPVYYKGYKIGITKKIEPSKDFKSTFVTIYLYPDEFKLPENTTAKVSQLRNGLDYIALIYPKEPSDKFLKTGSIIEGKTTMDIQSFMSAQAESGTLGSMTENVNSTLASVGRVGDELTILIRTLTSAVNENRSNIRFATSSIAKSAADINTMTENLNHSMDSERIENLSASIEETAANINAVTTNLNQTLSRVDAAACQLHGASSNVNAITGTVRNSMQKRLGIMRIILGNKSEPSCNSATRCGRDY